MFSLVRKVVAGPKKTTKFQGSDLDLTYITDRVIAMAFPASDLIEKTYRNPIEDVAAYFQQNHPNNYLIINVSSRLYDYSAFNNRVKDYQWPDHQAPSLTTLIKIGYQIYKYLKDNPSRVIAVHCNHGKGRTGTAIISFLMLIGYYESASECLKFYNSKRFNKDTYGVDQPCQVRYLSYIQKLMKAPKIQKKLICYRLKDITYKGLSCQYFAKIYFTRNQRLIFQKVNFGIKVDELKNNCLLADIFIQIYRNSWNIQKKVTRINYNLYFLDPNHLEVTFYGKDLKLSDNHHEYFQITLHFQYFCLCHLPMYEQTVCKCKTERIIQQKYWNEMILQIKDCKKISNKDMLGLLQKKKGRQIKKQKRGGSQQKYIYVDTSNTSNSSSFLKKKNISNNRQKLTNLIQQKMQKRIFEQYDEDEFDNNIYASCIQFPKTRQVQKRVQYYEDQPTIKITKVQKIYLEQNINQK